MIAIGYHILLKGREPFAIQEGSIGAPQVDHGEVSVFALEQAVAAGHAVLIGVEVRQVQSLFRTGRCLATQDERRFKRYRHTLARGGTLQDGLGVCVKAPPILYRDRPRLRAVSPPRL
jgi:hypothetical protein